MQHIIDKFGGQVKVAELCGISQPAVSYWVTKGMIPSKWQGFLLQKAREKNIKLVPADFFKDTENAQ